MYRKFFTAPAGWHCWKINLAQPCEGCGKANKFYTLSGTIDNAQAFANNPEFNYCEKCS